MNNQSKVCGNCWYWKDSPNDGGRIPNNMPGKCMAAPTPVSRFQEDIACLNFDTKYPQSKEMAESLSGHILENINEVFMSDKRELLA